MNKSNRTKTESQSGNPPAGNTGIGFCLLLFFLLSPFFLSYAQSFSNLSFEYWQGNKYPLFWQHPGVTVSPDSITKLSGQYALKAVRLKPEAGSDRSPYGLLFQDIRTAFELSAIQNKKLDVSVRLKSHSDDTSAMVSAFIQIVDNQNPKNNAIALGNNVANREWAESTASIAVGKLTPTSTVLAGVIIMGAGEVWADDYQIICDGQTADDARPRTTDLTQKEKKWLTSEIIPIAEETVTRKKQFAKKISRARLIGIGDNVHGSSSVFKLKNIVSDNLIGNHGFTLLAVEDSPDVGEALNRYVSGLTDTVVIPMNVMYSNPVFRDFLSGLREYNKTAVKKVRIFGVDINSRYEEQFQQIDRSTSNRYSAELDSVRSILESGIKNWNPVSKTKIPFSGEQKQFYSATLERIKESIPSLNTDDSQKIVLEYYVDNLLHYLTFDVEEREIQMAGNVGWLLSRYPDEKMIYLAHNSHVGNLDNSAGAWLKKRFDDQYYMIGCCYFDGTDLFKKTAVENFAAPVINEAVKGSYEYLFNQIKDECFYLDVRGLTERPANKWLFQPMLMRRYGVETFNYYHEFSIMNLTHMFDGLVFIKTSVPL